jgi:DNA-binding transcriptional MerR regulator
MSAVSRPDPAPDLPPAALREFEREEKRGDWQEGVSLGQLLERVNRVAVLLVPERGRDSRVSRTFSERSFRHYQTLGCIDPPEKEGRAVAYGHRHFLQALLVRRLLGEGMPAERITALMAGRSTAETRQLLFDGIEIVARHGEAADADEVESWKRIRVTPGVELHLRTDLPKPKPRELKKLLAHLETALRKNL